MQVPPPKEETTQRRSRLDVVADADRIAEGAFEQARLNWIGTDQFRDAALYAIAAELRAARISKRPSSTGGVE